MADLVSVKAYDGTLVRIPRDKLQYFLVQQDKIIKLIKENKTIDEINALIKEGAL